MNVPLMNIYILNFDGSLPHPELSDMYLQTARELARSRQKYARFSSEDCALEIRTSYECRSIGFIFGVEFVATFHCAHGHNEIRFIVQSHALEGNDHIGLYIPEDQEITISCGNLN